MPTSDDDIYATEVFHDPHAYYGALRETAPVFWNQRNETWLLTRHEDVVWMVRQAELFSSENWRKDRETRYPPIEAADRPLQDEVMAFRSRELIQNDKPDHTRLRSPLTRSFATKAIESWRPVIREVIAYLLDKAMSTGSVDVVRDLAAPLPLLVISELLGVPEEHRDMLKAQADMRMRSALSLGADRMRIAWTGITESSSYFDDLVGQRLDRGATGSDDLIGVLMAAEESGTISRQELLANVQKLVDAGHETTIRLIANGTAAFVRNPRQWDLLRTAPDVLSVGAAEESLRYDPPLTMVRRVARRTVERGGQQITAGDRVAAVLASANRDPRVFIEPDTFDITRSPNPHVAFGGGPHYCLGQYLARVEGQEAFQALAERFPSLRLGDGGIEYREDYRVRFIDKLPISVG